VFSTYSDIWAFGIVLWEFFTLGKVPYPGMNADESLFFKLRDGYRMERPQYATQNVYDIMLSCWRKNPETRPLFKELEKTLGTMLDDSVKDHYMDLNDPYLKMNMSQFQEGATDYLGMLGTPDQMAPAPPTYVNGNLQLIRELNEAENQPDYLRMSPRTGSVRYNAGSSTSPTRESLGYSTGGDSPTLQNNLDLNDSKGRTKKSGLPEERPMLATRESDSESEGSPDSKRAANKSKFSEMNPLDDSYLNFRPAFAPNDAFSNPGYVSVKTVNEKA
jgi:FMS-like tyrosine kinase 1